MSEQSNWRKGVSDPYVIVLIRLKRSGMELVRGFHDRETWRTNTNEKIIPSLVVGWMHIDQAARVLDGE